MLSLAELMRHEHASLALAQRCSAVSGARRRCSLPWLNYERSPGAAQPLSQDSLLAWEGISWLRGQERTNYPVTLSVDDLGEGFGLSAQTVASIAPMRVCQFMHTALESLAEALQNTPAAPLHTLQVLPTAGASSSYSTSGTIPRPSFPQTSASMNCSKNR